MALTFGYPQTSEADLYKWKDDNGKTHFTDDPGKIPPQYRIKSKTKIQKDLPQAPKSAPSPVKEEVSKSVDESGEGKEAAKKFFRKEAIVRYEYFPDGQTMRYHQRQKIQALLDGVRSFPWAYMWTGTGSCVVRSKTPGFQIINQRQEDLRPEWTRLDTQFPHSLREGEEVEFVPFRWTNGGGMVALDGPSGRESGIATGVSFDGSVVVGSLGCPICGFEAFRWTSAGGMVGLGDMGDFTGQFGPLQGNCPANVAMRQPIDRWQGDCVRL